MYIEGIAFQYQDNPNIHLHSPDISVLNSDLKHDEGFVSACIILLGTNARADDTDTLPHTLNSRGGFWGNVLLGFNLGSKLWLLERSKLTQETKILFDQYTLEALNPLIQLKAVKEITVNSTLQRDRIKAEVLFIRPSYNDTYLRFDTVWNEQLGV
jgi:phage gp46-like protein